MFIMTLALCVFARFGFALCALGLSKCSELHVRRKPHMHCGNLCAEPPPSPYIQHECVFVVKV